MTADRIALETAIRALSGAEVWNLAPAGGYSSVTSYRVETGEGTFAVRAYPHAKTAAAYRQADLLHYLHQQGFPVPEVTFVGEHGDLALIGVAWLPGAPLLGAVTAQPERVADLACQFGAVQARLHALCVPEGVQDRLKIVNVSGASSEKRAWLHLDYHPLNVMVDGGEVVGVLDWENVRLGDPRIDVARSLSILTVDPGLRAAPPEVRAGLRGFRQAYLDGYRAAGGCLDDLAPFLAWAGDFMLRDQAQRYPPEVLSYVARWTSHWQAR